MKAIILAGGLGTRISEETKLKPKPMVLIDDKPILWHIMNIYASQGFDEFIVAIGYRGEVIENWISSLDTEWKISTMRTGLETQTGGRIRQVVNAFEDKQFMVTYGDGVGNINIRKLIEFHNSHGKLATVTAVRPPARFGVLQSHRGLVQNFGEKTQTDGGWINGGFFVINREAIAEIHDDSEPFESHALPRLVDKKQLMAHHHMGFWKPMDTLRERDELAEMALISIAPWLEGLKNY
jgi:glucose-1-phosphate cytidylyltransferase